MDYYGSIREEAFALLPENLDGVLDVGGGRGRTAGELKRRFGASRVGLVDLFAKHEECDSDLDFIVNADLDDSKSIASVTREHGPFSVVLCMDVLEHLKDPWSCVRTLSASLSPNGVLIASIPNVSHLSVVVKLALFGQWRLHDAGILDRTHLRFFTNETAIELMESGGLGVDRIQSLYVGDWSVIHRFKFLRHVLGERFLAYQYLLRAQRVEELSSGERT